MGTLNEKLEYLKETKDQIKEAIISKGQEVSSSDTFRSYASKIAAIENGDVITATNTTGSDVSVDDKVWIEPQDTDPVTYNIIPSKLVTSTSFTAVAQTSIENNTSGSVKTILDGNGSYAPTLGTKIITRNNTYSASADNLYGYSSVTVNVEDIPAVVESLSITPTTSEQSFTPTSGVDGYSPVTVSAVDSSIDANITAGNIKKDVTILGVTGTLEEGTAINNQNISVTTDGTYTADSGYTGLGTVTVTAGATASSETENQIAEQLMLINDGQKTFTLNVTPVDAEVLLVSTTNSVSITPTSSSDGTYVYDISMDSSKSYTYSVSKTGYETQTGVINSETSQLSIVLQETNHSNSSEIKPNLDDDGGAL